MWKWPKQSQYLALFHASWFQTTLPIMRDMLFHPSWSQETDAWRLLTWSEDWQQWSPGCFSVTDGDAHGRLQETTSWWLSAASPGFCRQFQGNVSLVDGRFTHCHPLSPIITHCCVTHCGWWLSVGTSKANIWPFLMLLGSKLHGSPNNEQHGFNRIGVGNRLWEGLLARCAQQVGPFTQWHEYVAHRGGWMPLSKLR
jgi:hypothetical protein